MIQRRYWVFLAMVLGAAPIARTQEQSPETLWSQRRPAGEPSIGGPAGDKTQEQSPETLWSQAEQLRSKGLSEAAASRPSSRNGSACAPLLRVWREEAKGLGDARVAAYERLVEEAFARYHLRLPEGFETPYRASLRRAVTQFRPCFGAFGGDWDDGAIRWLAWCTLEACDRRTISPEELEELRKGYVALYADVLTKARAHLIAGPDPALSEASSKVIEEHLNASAEVFEKRLLDLQADFLYPALKAPLTASQRATVVARYDNPRLYPAWGDVTTVTMTPEQLYVSGAVALVDQFPDLVHFDILVEDSEPRQLNTKWWGRVLSRGDGIAGAEGWPGVMALRLPAFRATSRPTTGKAHK